MHIRFILKHIAMLIWFILKHTAKHRCFGPNLHICFPSACQYHPSKWYPIYALQWILTHPPQDLQNHRGFSYFQFNPIFYSTHWHLQLHHYLLLHPVLQLPNTHYALDFLPCLSTYNSYTSHPDSPSAAHLHNCVNLSFMSFIHPDYHSFYH